MTASGYMEVIGKIAVDNSMSFEGVKIPCTPDDYVPSMALISPHFLDFLVENEKMKTCQFEAISDLATRSISFQKFF